MRQMNDFRAILDAHHPILYKVARAYTDDDADFDDLYQEMLIQIWKAHTRFREESKLSTYLYRICLNTAMSWRRSETRRQERVVRGDVEAMAAKPNGDDAPSERQEALRRCIGRLNANDRSIILLHLDGIPYAQMAEILGLSESNVGVRLNRIRKALKHCISHTS